MADRKEFSAKTRKIALARSGGICEAVGTWYGLPAGERCKNDLRIVGVEYDHVILDANSKDNSLENCAAVCPKCHGWKTRNRDIPTAAKTVAQSLMGMKTRPKQAIQSPGFAQSEKAAKRAAKPPLTPKALYQEVTT